MQPHARQEADIIERYGRVERGQNAPDAFCLIGLHAARVACLVEAAQAAMSEAHNHNIGLVYSDKCRLSSSSHWHGGFTRGKISYCHTDETKGSFSFMLNRFFSRQRNQSVTVNETSERIGGVKYGYARVSTVEQNLNLQLDRLRADGCEEIFSDKGVSGAATEREGLSEALARLQSGDTLVVWKLDRLGRSLQHLIALLDELKERGVEFRSLTDSIDTSTASGKLHFTMIAALAEFERGIISERTREGLRVAREQGVKFGRKPSLSFEQAQLAHDAIIGRAGKRRTRKSVAKSLKVSEPTLRRTLRRYGFDGEDGE